MNFVAIIPSLGALGPLGLLALLAPAVFASLMLWMRRWKAVLGAASAMSTVYLLQGWWQPPLRPTWWSSRAGLWTVLAGLAGAFLLWAIHRARVTGRVAEWTTLLIAAIGCGGNLLWDTVRAPLSTELRVEWTFEPNRTGAFLNSPFISDDRIYLSADHQEGFQRRGAIYAVNASSGQVHWVWQSDSEMRPIYSTPAVHENRLYVGEGLHSDHSCRLRCIETSGHLPNEQWAFETQSHIESNPALNGESVFFGAGDDGLYCAESTTGKKVWHLENLHIDATPLVETGVVYVGSYRAEDNQHKDLRLLALEAATGKLIWSEPIDLSSYSQPAIADSTVYFSLGTGDFESSGPKPAGAVVAIDAATGRQAWRADFPDSVFGSPTVYNEFVVVACRDGAVYALNQRNGQRLWRRNLGSPIVAAPSIDYDHEGAFVLAIGKSGRCVKLSLQKGALRGEIDLVHAASGTSGVFTAAPTTGFSPSVGRRIYIAGTITRGVRETPILFCLTDKP